MLLLWQRLATGSEAGIERSWLYTAAPTHLVEIDDLKQCSLQEAAGHHKVKQALVQQVLSSLAGHQTSNTTAHKRQQSQQITA
jgi:hypothetical protein